MSNNNEINMPNGMPTFEQCPEWGNGGQYIFDPITQTRTRVVAVGEPVVEAAAADAVAVSTQDSTALDSELAVLGNKRNKENPRG